MLNQLTTANDHTTLTANLNAEADSDSDSDDDLETDLYDQPRRLPTLATVFHSISSAMDSLCQASRIATRPAFERKYLHSTGHDDLDASAALYGQEDLRYVEEKMRQWK